MAKSRLHKTALWDADDSDAVLMGRLLMAANVIAEQEGIAPADLAARNAQMSMGTSLSETLAFALGGWLYQALGAVFALAVDAVTYLLSAAFVRGG